MEKDFKTLGLPNNATKEEIKKAYKNLAKIYHPDKKGPPEKFIELNQAYTRLINPSTFTYIFKEMEEMDERLKEIRKQSKKMHERFDNIEKQFEQIEKKIDTLQKEMEADREARRLSRKKYMEEYEDYGDDSS